VLWTVTERQREGIEWRVEENCTNVTDKHVYRLSVEKKETKTIIGKTNHKTVCENNIKTDLKYLYIVFEGIDWIYLAQGV
jgi:hypothetical protein